MAMTKWILLGIIVLFRAVSADGQYNPLDLLVSAQAWKGYMAWAGGGYINADYKLLADGNETYTDMMTPSNFAAFVDAPDAEKSLLIDLDASMCCWQFVQTILADNNIQSWSMEALHTNENVALQRSHDIDIWLQQWNVLAADASSEGYYTSFHAEIAYLGMTVAMLGAGEDTSTAWFDSKRQTFKSDECPPTGAIVSFGYTSHFLVSAGPPDSSSNDSDDFDPMQCRFVHLFHGGCADSIDCWGADHTDYTCVPDVLEAPCNSTHVYESDLLYLANVTQQWSRASEIDWLTPRVGADGLNKTEASRAWAYVAATFERGLMFNDPEIESARYLLQQLNTAGAVSDSELSEAGISAEQLQSFPATVDISSAINLLASLFEQQMSI